VDQWSPKVVRASAGAVFHVPIWSVQGLETLRSHGVRLLGTTSHESLSVSHPESMYDCDYSGLVGVVLGNEAHGLDPEAPVDGWITIEHAGRSESLNVAMAGTVFAMHVAHCRNGNQ
jgi:TrmH family RNA methyltransferase